MTKQIGSMQGDINKQNLDAKSLRQQASDAQTLVEQRNTKLTTELSNSRRQADLLEREVNNTPHTESPDVVDERDALQLEIREQNKARETSETGVRERDRQISIANAKLKQATDELTEQHQSINVYRSVVDEQDFKLASLSEEIANLMRCRDLEKRTSAEPTESYDGPAARLQDLDNN